MFKKFKKQILSKEDQIKNIMESKTISTKMKAVICNNYGPPSSLQFKEVDRPVPKAEEVLVKVKASTINRTDCAILRASPFIMRFVTGLFKPGNPILGTEFSGIVKNVGKDVENFKEGDLVFGFYDPGLGAHAEYLTIHKNKPIALLPDELSFIEGAASLEGAHYAYTTIKNVKIEKGQKILLNGATGAIGSAALQMLVHLGVEVTAVANTKNIELIKSLGAKRVIDYLKEDFTLENEKYDYIFDTVGKSSFGKCKKQLVDGGVYISSELGWMCENIFYSLFTPVFGKKKVKFPIPTNIPESIAYVKKLIAAKAFKTVIDREYPLNEIVAAYEYVEKGEKTGNVVIVV